MQVIFFPNSVPLGRLLTIPQVNFVQNLEDLLCAYFCYAVNLWNALGK